MEHIVKRILTARVYDVAKPTRLERARRLSEELENNVLIKREDQQSVFSFKLRGAYNKIVGLSAEQRARGVIAASAGNHAQGVALAGRELGCKATIVMPETTPSIKVEAVEALGGIPELHGENYDQASEYAQQLAAREGQTFIPPYDDDEVIAGQGTIGMELLQQQTGALDAVFIPVGGGGLVAGIAAYVKYLRPDIKVIAVEPEDSACLKAALDAGDRVELERVGQFADGVAVRKVGKAPFEIAKHCVDDVITVTTDEICAAVRDLFIDLRATAEPAGAVGLAGLRKYVENTAARDQTLVTLVSGANVNFDRLRHIAERAETGAHREALLAVTIPEQPGSFRAFCESLGNRPITEFNYRYAESGSAHIFVGLRLQSGSAERHALLEQLADNGYDATDLTDNEMAKNHVRYMVGGRSDLQLPERLFRFEFPERPGALLRFLDSLSPDWNISLFHYRNHGADYGRVLAGIQVPNAAEAELDNALAALGYVFTEETSNPAHRFFLGG